MYAYGNVTRQHITRELSREQTLEQTARQGHQHSHANTRDGVGASLRGRHLRGPARWHTGTPARCCTSNGASRSRARVALSRCPWTVYPGLGYLVVDDASPPPPLPAALHAPYRYHTQTLCPRKAHIPYRPPEDSTLHQPTPQASASHDAVTTAEAPRAQTWRTNRDSAGCDPTRRAAIGPLGQSRSPARWRRSTCASGPRHVARA